MFIQQCPDNILKKLKFKFVRNAYPHLGPSYTTCIGGCDNTFNETIGIISHTVRRGQNVSNDSGFQSGNASRHNSTQGSIRPTQNQTNRQQPPSAPWSQGNQNQNWNQNRNNDFSSSGSSYGTQNRPGNARPQGNSNFKAGASSATSSGNATFSWANNEDHGEIMCHCHQLAKELTVRKEGPNQG